MKKDNGVSASSFHLPLRFLLPVQRRAMHILYDFCREADDAVDNIASKDDAVLRLIGLRQRIHVLYSSGNVADPLHDIIESFALKREYFESILDGMEMDVKGQMLKPDLLTLQLYCYRVAGCVGLLSLAIFGVKDIAAEMFAVALGHALQLTNILRDVQEDAARGRLYLPLEWLQGEGAAGLMPDTLKDYAKAVEAVCKRLAVLAQEYFAEAERLSHQCNQRRLLPALLMRDVYFAYLQRMCAHEYFLQRRMMRLGFWQKITITINAMRYSWPLRSAGNTTS